MSKFSTEFKQQAAVPTSARIRRIQRRLIPCSHQGTTKQRAVGYLRVSTGEQAIRGFGLAAQKRHIQSFAKSQGYRLRGFIADAGISGASQPEERPNFSKLLDLARMGAFDVLLVWKFDRLARNVLHAVTMANRLREDHGILLRSVTEPIDTGTSMGSMFFAVLASMAEQERRTITERTMAGKVEKATQGGFAGGAVPLGYRRDLIGGIVVNQAEAQTVQRIFSLSRKGASLRAIVDQLKKENIPTKRGGRWYPGTVAYILDNPKYRGLVEYYFRWETMAHVLRKGGHPALVSRKTGVSS